MAAQPRITARPVLHALTALALAALALSVTYKDPPTGGAQQDDVIAMFSSRGPTMGFDTIKPDITAPGMQILAGNVGVGDFAGDNLSDIAGIGCSSPQTAGCAALVFAQTSNGTFGPPSQFPLPSGCVPAGLAVGDFNLSGRDDMVYGCGDGRVFLFLDNNFNSPFRTFNPGVGPIVDIALGTINPQDQFLDIAVLGTQGWVVITHSSGAVFVVAVPIPLTGGTGIAVGPVNLPGPGGDSSPDIVISQSLDPGNTGSVFVYPNDGLGGFSSQPSHVLQAGINPIGVHVLNIDGTAGNDIITLNQGSGTLSAFLL